MDQKEVDFTVHFRIGSTQRNYWKSWRRLDRRCRIGCRAKQSVTRPGEPGRTRKRPGEAGAAVGAGTDATSAGSLATSPESVLPLRLAGPMPEMGVTNVARRDISPGSAQRCHVADKRGQTFEFTHTVSPIILTYWWECFLQKSSINLEQFDFFVKHVNSYTSNFS